MKVEGIVLDIGFSFDNIRKQSYGIMEIRMQDGKIAHVKIPFDPYFYAKLPGELARDLADLRMDYGTERVDVKRVEKKDMLLLGETISLYKIVCYHPSHVPFVKRVLSDYPCYEFSIPYSKRFIIDNNILLFSKISAETDEENVLIEGTLKMVDENPPTDLTVMSFDIEVYNPEGIPDPKKDAIIMISYATNKNGAKTDEGVLTYRKVGLESATIFKSEEEMLGGFCDAIMRNNPDIITGYNIERFDLQYLYKRAERLGMPLLIGRNGEEIAVRKHGQETRVHVPGRTFFDVYNVMRFMNTVGALKLPRLTLKAAYREISGGNEMETKELINRREIWKAWDDNEMRSRLAEYNLGDSHAAALIANEVLPLEIELSKTCRESLSETANSTTGRLVESLLMHQSFSRTEIIPNIPDENEVRARMTNPIQGAYVKMPAPGIYENMAVFDFRGLYPSIIISHNIDPSTLNYKGCKEDAVHVSPLNHKFCQMKKGIIPEVLDMLVNRRGGIKKLLKKHKPESNEYKTLFARSQAYKIVANSFYGYMAYARSRWYSRDCGASTTAWGRYYITKTIDEAEKKGFSVLYGDTDSIMMVLKDKTEEDAIGFMNEVNKGLPEKMELELEGFYPRGVFVSKRGADTETGAKKKYAMIDKEGRIKIRGFELVRRDWSEIAKKTQMDVLKAILKDGDSKMAADIVKNTVKRLKEGKVPLEELVIYTQIQKDPNSYAVKSPELSAARKGLERGVDIAESSVIGFVITKNGETTSDKADLIEFAKDYDADYYVDKQVMPAVLKILKELGYTEEELKGKGKQHTLDSFFG